MNNKCINEAALARYIKNLLSKKETETISNHLKTCKECRSYYEISVSILEDISEIELETISVNDAKSSLNKLKPLILSSDKENIKKQKTVSTLIKKSTKTLSQISDKVSKTVLWIHTKTKIPGTPLQFDFAVRGLPNSAVYMQFQEVFDRFPIKLFLQKWNNNNFRLYAGYAKTDKLQHNLRITLSKDHNIVASNLIKSDFNLIGIFSNGTYDILLNNQKKIYTINNTGLTKNANLS